MFSSEYYALVAGFREYTLEQEAKGFDANAIREEVLEGVSAADGAAVRLLYTYYDCENIVARRASRKSFNELGNITREQLEDLAQSRYEGLLPDSLVQVLIDADSRDGVEQTLSFESQLFGAYYEECAKSKCRFLRGWAECDRNIKNIAAALTARKRAIEVESVVVGGGDVVEQLIKSSAADFGLRAELPYIDALIAAINDEANLLEKERKIDLIKWEESSELLNFDYFNINAVMSYLVKVNIVARWTALDAKLGREMFERMVAELSAEDKIK